jgi:hypothetical protein
MNDAATTGSAMRFGNRVPVRASVLGSALAFALVLTATAPARGSLVVDQSYLPFQSAGEAYNLSYSGNLPLGQQFVPTLNSLSFVNLWIEDAGTNAGDPATIQVNIRSSSITGTLLGSSTAVVPAGTNTGGGNTLTGFSFLPARRGLHFGNAATGVRFRVSGGNPVHA